MQVSGSDLGNADVLLSQFMDEESIESLIDTGSQATRTKNKLKMQEVREPRHSSATVLLCLSVRWYWKWLCILRCFH